MEQAAAFYTPKEVADYLKVSERTVRRWIAEGRLRAIRFGRQLRVPVEALHGLGKPVEPRLPEETWAELALDSFAEDWDNELDAAYDDWETHYGVPQR